MRLSLRPVPFAAFLVGSALALGALGCGNDSGGGGGRGAGTAAGGSTGSSPTQLLAGAAAIDVTPPVGVPLAGFGGGDRRLTIPDINPFNYVFWLAPSTGTHDPIQAKCLVLDDGQDRVAIVTLDAIATVGEVVTLAHQMATAQGFTVPIDHLLVCSSHTHSGPGAISSLRFWNLTAADELVPSVRDGFAAGVARALLAAERSLQPAVLGYGSGSLVGITKNRRAGESPYYTEDSIDPELGVIRVDTPAGQPIATVWNFAIHGISLGTSNHEFSADIMGAASADVERQIGGVCLFANGAEGDISPRPRGLTEMAQGAQTIADTIEQVRAGIAPRPAIDIAAESEVVPFGDAALDFSINRAGQGTIDDIGLLQFMQNHGLGSFGLAFIMDGTWCENTFRFTAIRLDRAVIASVPGEPIHDLGLEIKGDGLALGYDQTFVFGLANGHMAYITTEREYWIGGYEALATFFGPRTGENVRNACQRLMARVR